MPAVCRRTRESVVRMIIVRLVRIVVIRRKGGLRA